MKREGGRIFRETKLSPPLESTAGCLPYNRGGNQRGAKRSAQNSEQKEFEDMKKAILVIMAAGMGAAGGLKQMEPISDQRNAGLRHHPKSYVIRK